MIEPIYYELLELIQMLEKYSEYFDDSYLNDIYI
jgi:hypothetical protein